MCFAPQRRALCRRWGVLYVFTSKRAPRHNSVQLFISHLSRWLRTRRFSEPTFGPSGATNHRRRRNTVFRDFSTFSGTLMFFLLLFSSLTLPISAFHLSILSEVWLLNFLRQLHYNYNFNYTSTTLQLQLQLQRRLHFSYYHNFNYNTSTSTSTSTAQQQQHQQHHQQQQQAQQQQAQLELQLQHYNINNINYTTTTTTTTTLQLQTTITATIAFHVSTPHYVLQFWVRWPLQPLQKAQPPFGPWVGSLRHPCITATHLSYSFLSLKLSRPPCAVLLAIKTVNTINYQ